MPGNQCRGFDFTLPAPPVVSEGEGDSVSAMQRYTDAAEKITRVLEQHCSQWVFQLERGEQTGYVHFQGRMRLREKGYVPKVLREWPATVLPGVHLSVTTCRAFTTRNFDYVTKDETRVQGPWTERDVRLNSEQLAAFVASGIRPWHRAVVDTLRQQDHSHIDLLVHTAASQLDRVDWAVFKEWLQHQKLSYQVQAGVEQPQHLLRCVFNLPPQPGYTVTLPVYRLDRDGLRLRKFLNAIEDVKCGESHDPRWNHRERIVRDRPRVLVSATAHPGRDVLSAHWRCWMIDEAGQLVPFTPPAADP
jgi:hypothetical protein